MKMDMLCTIIGGAIGLLIVLTFVLDSWKVGFITLFLLIVATTLELEYYIKSKDKEIKK